MASPAFASSDSAFGRRSAGPNLGAGEGLGFREVRGLNLRGLGFRGVGFRVQGGLGFREFWGRGCRV